MKGKDPGEDACSFRSAEAKNRGGPAHSPEASCVAGHWSNSGVPLSTARVMLSTQWMAGPRRREEGIEVRVKSRKIIASLAS